jgi:hypothetical protein
VSPTRLCLDHLFGRSTQGPLARSAISEFSASFLSWNKNQTSTFKQLRPAPELLCKIRSHRVDLAELIASDRGIRFGLIIVELELLFRIYPCGCSPSVFQNVFGLNRHRFVGDLRAMPNSCWLSSRGMPRTHGIKAISMPIESSLE